jgi:zeta-carotene desaturase
MLMTVNDNVTITVTVVGAGVAGLAVSCALAGAGYDVELVERRPFVGGRASSYVHPALQEVVDCQHVLLGCCTNLIHLLEESDAGRLIRWYDEFVFLEPGGRSSIFRPNGLPVPLHFSGSFLRASMFGLADKLAIARGMREFLSATEKDDDISLELWLKQTKQTPLAVRNFWEPVMYCTLNDSAANCSLRMAGKVFRELFLKSSAGAKFGIPTVPLSEFYSAAARLLESRGGRLYLRESVEAIRPADKGKWTLHTSTGERTSDVVVLALPFEQTQKLIAGLPKTDRGSELERTLGQLIHAPYTTVHLWFDRQITDLDYAALLNTTIQWVFHKSRIRRYPEERGSYVELVIAGARDQLKKSRQEIFDNTKAELTSFFPEARRAQIVKSAILKEAQATFSVLPGLDKLRPTSVSPWPGIYLAGDWAATGWPSTMESAARSGYLAAEAVTNAYGQKATFLQPDVPAAGIMRLFG